MRILCRHGHLSFYPSNAGDISYFCSYFGVELERVGDYYTFPFLAAAKRYSIQGHNFLNLPAVVNYEGREPWDVMRENNFVYLISAGVLVPKSSVVIPITLPQTSHYFLSQTPLIQPGSRNQMGQQIISYDAEWIQDVFQLRLLEFVYE